MFNGKALSAPPPQRWLRRQSFKICRPEHTARAKVLISSKYAFTLAEVLITLGIIGVVAAVTMPTLITKNEKKIVETKLEKFYSLMSQAVISWENNNNMLPEDVSLPTSVSDIKEWWENSLGKEIKSTSIENVKSKYVLVTLPDGSAVSIFPGGGVIHFTYCIKKTYCSETRSSSNNSVAINGKHNFLFTLQNGEFVTSRGKYDDYTRDQLLSDCKAGSSDDDDTRQGCTRLIETDGWTIKDDYPWAMH